MLEKLEPYNKIFLVLSIILATMIFLFSNLSSPEVSKQTAILPFLYHFGIFSSLQLSILLSLKKKNFQFMPLTILISSFYAILDELHQFFVPGRFFSIWDIITDVNGILFATIIYIILTPTLKNTSRLKT